MDLNQGFKTFMSSRSFRLATVKPESRERFCPRIFCSERRLLILKIVLKGELYCLNRMERLFIFFRRLLPYVIECVHSGKSVELRYMAMCSKKNDILTVLNIFNSQIGCLCFVLAQIKNKV